MGVVPPYADIFQVNPYFSTIAGGGGVKVTAFLKSYSGRSSSDDKM